MIRSVWKKDKGYKFYRLTSIYPYNGNKDGVKQSDSQQQSSSGDHNCANSESAREGQSEVKLLTFEDLA